MSVYDTREFRKGLKIEMNGQPLTIVDFQHVNPGKGAAFTRLKTKNLRTGQVIEQNIKRGDKVGKPNLQDRNVQFLYKDSQGYHFMDTENYESVMLQEDDVEDVKFYLLEQAYLKILFFEDKPIGVEVGTFVELKVTQTEPAIKGDTATGASKQAIMETGLSVSVPLHIKEGDTLRVDTRTGDYMDRVQRA